MAFQPEPNLIHGTVSVDPNGHFHQQEQNNVSVVQPDLTPLSRIDSEIKYKGFMRCCTQSCRSTRKSVLSKSGKLSISGWLSLVISLATGLLALRYAYNSQVLAYKSMELAEWTAKKDFLALCQDSEASNSSINLDCAKASRHPLPPPPYVDLDNLDRADKRATLDFCKPIDAQLFEYTCAREKRSSSGS